MKKNKNNNSVDSNLFYKIIFGFIFIAIIIFVIYNIFSNNGSSFFHKNSEKTVNSEEQIKYSTKPLLAKVIAPSTGKVLEVAGVSLKTTSNTAHTAKSAYLLLLTEAQKWQKDAVLVSIKSDQDIALDGKSIKWGGYFISKNDHTKGWSATLQDGVVVDVQEKKATADVLSEPKFTTDSDMAIKSALGDFGAVELRVLSIQLFQESMSGEWFWSMETESGNLTLKAK